MQENGSMAGAAEPAQKTALIIGASIGGLGVAVALHRNGYRVRIFDKAAVLPGEDDGLVLTSPAMNVLQHYQLAKHLTHKGPGLKHFVYRKPSGNPLMRLSLESPNQSLDEPILALNRTTVAETLLQALPKNALILKKQLIDFEEHKGVVTAHFAGGHYEQGNLLIGADGTGSVIRRHIAPNKASEYAGYICWTGISPRADLIEAGTLFESSGQGHRFGATNIGGGKVYWFACVNLKPHIHFGSRTREELVLRFLRFHTPVAALIESTPEHKIKQTPCYKTPPAHTWSKGRVTLLGNAAHPMNGVLSQDTCQALEDGYVLAACLAACETLPTALQNYQDLRAPKVASIQRTAQITGRLGQVEHPLACSLRNLAMRYSPRFSLQRHYNQLLGLDNSRVSA